MQRADGSGGITYNKAATTLTDTLRCVVCCVVLPVAVTLPSLDDAPPLQFKKVTDPGFMTVQLDFAQYASLDERGKLDLVLMVACRVCANHTEPQNV